MRIGIKAFCFLPVSLFLLVIQNIFFTYNAHAELDPRVRTVSTLALYGTVGGALLGTATMAYGTSSRAIFKGASLGLYAGLLFGAYVVISHQMKEQQQVGQEVYPQEVGPGTYQEESSGNDYSDALTQRWVPSLLEKSYSPSRVIGRSFPLFIPFQGRDLPLMQINFFKKTF